MDESETDVLSHLDFPEQHRAKIHSTNPLERLNKEVKRRADVVGIFPNEASMDVPTMLPIQWACIIGRQRSQGGPAVGGRTGNTEYDFDCVMVDFDSPH